MPVGSRGYSFSGSLRLFTPVSLEFRSASVQFRGCRFRFSSLGFRGVFGYTYSRHCSSILALPFGFLNITWVKPKKVATMETVGRLQASRYGGGGGYRCFYGFGSGL